MSSKLRLFVIPWIVTVLSFASLNAVSQTNSVTDESDRQKTAAMLRRLQNTVIPEINLRDASIEEAIRVLETEGAKYASDGGRFHFSTKIVSNATITIKRPAGLIREEIEEIERIETTLRDRQNQSGLRGSHPVNVRFRKLPLLDTCKLIGPAAGLNFKITSEGGLFTNERHELEARIYERPDNEEIRSVDLDEPIFFAKANRPLIVIGSVTDHEILEEDRKSVQRVRRRRVGPTNSD